MRCLIKVKEQCNENVVRHVENILNNVEASVLKK